MKSEALSIFNTVVIMYIDTTLLSRAQFGFTIGFHILFPTLNIGLAIFLSCMEALWLKTKNPVYLTICKFWTKIFALTFGMGVVSGIVMSYELGTNFGPFILAVGSVLGSLFAYEVLSAFFLEAGFLGVMLFGWNKVGKKLHFCATLFVTIGTIISAFWIMSANSWMQTPAGYHIEAGRYVVDNWWAVIFNPAFVPRFLHMLMASMVTCCFVVAGVSAWYLLENRGLAIAKKCFSLVMGAALILTFAQVLLGDRVGLEVQQYQPLKTAAMEGLWHTTKGAPLVLFGIPDSKTETNRYALAIPKGASFINTHHWNGELIGLTSVPADQRPLVSNVFFSFRVMVGIGFLMLAMAVYALWLRWHKQLFTKSWFLHLCVWTTPLGFISTIAGWLTAEYGRQPWIVYGLMRTAQGASQVPMNQVLTSLILFIIVYGIVFSFYLVYLFKVIRKGPDDLAISADMSVDAQPPFTYMRAETK